MHVARQYWDWTGGNIGAMPLQGLIAFAAGLIFRHPLARFFAWFRKEEAGRAAQAARDARDARKIAADLYERVTGEQHPRARTES